MRICTIAARNYLGRARVLASSYSQHNPGGECTVLLLDDPGRTVGDATEPFEILRPSEIGIDDFEGMAAMYETLELATAVKPWLLRYLVDREAEPVAYLDPDIRFYADIGDLAAILDEHPLVLNPHVVFQPPPRDGERPDELILLACGIYNLGFIGLAPHPQTGTLLDWWSERLRYDCVVDHAFGYFVDQRWFDLVHAVAPDFHVVRDPGFNVGHWNLHERTIERRGDRYTANGEPLRFFHFSGFDPQRPDELSKHQSRVRLPAHPALAELFDDYATELRRHGHESQTDEGPYARLADGTPLVPVLRDAYRTGAREGAFQSSPFTPEGTEEFFAWLREPADIGAHAGLTRLCLSVHRVRKDLASAYPDLDGQHGHHLLDWVKAHAHDELGVPLHLVPGMELDDPLSKEYGRGAPALFARLGEVSEVGGHAGVTHYLRQLHERRPDLRDAFPRIEGEDAWRLVDWAYRHGAAGDADELPIPPELLALDWLAEPVANGGEPTVSRYLEQLWARRPDLQRGFPDIMAGDAANYLEWARTFGVTDDPVLRAVLERRAAKPPRERHTPGEGSGGIAGGVNVVGLVHGELGLREAARLVIAALDAGGVPLIPVVPAGLSDAGFDTNLVCLNPDQHWKLVRQSDGAFGADRHTIGFWWWEVAGALRLEWRFAFPLVDEVWVASEHAAVAIRQVSPVPVVKVRLPVLPGSAARLTREELGLPDGFLFLSVFDYDSTLRKNPLATIEAFRTAFAPGSGAALVLKSVNGSAHPEQRRALEAAAAGHPDIHMIDRYLPVAEKNAMLAACDCCVSLHRAEGFGLPLAEAMYFGRPTIATRYSGNLEFMTDHNSYLVDHTMSPVGAAAEPYYPAEGEWAEPDLDHAARLMRRVFERRDEARDRGRRAAEDIRRDFSPQAAARTMTSRLDEIRSESPQRGGAASLIRRALRRPGPGERELLERAAALAAARQR